MTRYQTSMRLVLAVFLLALTACGGGGGGSSSGGGGTSGGGSGVSSPPLSITTTSLPDGVTGKSYSAKMAATGGTPPYGWSLQVGSFFPQGLSLDRNTGDISGTAGNQVFGNVTFVVRDSSVPLKSATAVIQMKINWPIDIYTSSVPPAHTNVPYDAVIQPDGYIKSWDLIAGSLPPGLQLTNPSQSQVEITGAATAPGNYNFTLQATSVDNPPQVTSKAFTLMVDNYAAILTSQLPDVITTKSYDTFLQAVNGTPPYHFSIQAPGILPAGLTLNPDTGEISGTDPGPGFQGGGPLTFQVADSAPNPSSSTRTITMRIVNPLSLNGPSYQNATVGQQFYMYLTPYGGAYPYAWSIVSGDLPAGLRMDENGNINGIPSRVGTYNFTIQVTDSTSPQQQAQMAQQVIVSPPALVVMASLPGRLPLNLAFDGFIAAQGGTPPYTWSLSSGSLPPGLQLNTANGEVSGTPTTLGNYTFQAQVVDSASQTAYQNYTVLVDTPLGRNDTIAKATPLGNGSTLASISPYADPVDIANPDTDYYKIYATPGTPVDIQVNRDSAALDPVLELVDANGARLNTCNLPPTLIGNFTSSCLNDDIDTGFLNSELLFKPSGNPGTQTVFYAHVLDWRGDARPDMLYYINVNGAVDTLAIVNSSQLAVGTKGAAYNVQLTTTGGTGAVTWKLLQGSLPPGLTLDPSGVISGTPNANGDFQFTLQAKDSGNPAQNATRSFSITVSDPVKIANSDQIPSGCVMQPFDFQLIVTGGTPPYNWTFDAPGDAGIGEDWRTGELRGTPQNTGVFILHIGVVDAYSRSDMHQVSWTVNNCQ